MTYKHFIYHWQEECFEDGVLTIPDGIDELYEDCCIAGNQEVYKVVLPQSGVEILGNVFQECANLVSIENFPCLFKETCEIVDEDTGDLISLEFERQKSVDEDAFKGCFKLFKDQQSIDEYGYVRLAIADKVYPIGYLSDDDSSFTKEMTALIKEMYDASEVAEKQDFCFCKTICRYGNDYEYHFENGTLYNKTNGTWCLFLPEYSNLHLVIPEWVREIYFEDFIHYRQLGCIKSMKFLGETDLGTFSDEHLAELESLELSDKHTAIPSEAFSHCPKLKTITFGNPECILEKRAFNGCTKLTSLCGLKEYSIYGGAIFYQGRIVSVLSNEVRYPEGSEWLDDCWVSHVLYLPKSIKYIEKPNEKEMDDREKELFEEHWSPIYLSIRTIVVATGYKEYFCNLFYEDLQKHKNCWRFADVTKEDIADKIMEI